MLTCEICGEELLLEDMKTHVLLNHLDDDMYCPLCSLSGVTFDELCLHISSAHPDKSAVTPLSGCLVSPDHERAKKVSDYSSRTTGEVKDVRDGHSSAGKPALVPSALTTRSTDPGWDFGRGWTEDDDAEEPVSLPKGLSNCSLSLSLILCSGSPTALKMWSF